MYMAMHGMASFMDQEKDDRTVAAESVFWSPGGGISGGPLCPLLPFHMYMNDWLLWFSLTGVMIFLLASVRVVQSSRSIVWKIPVNNIEPY